MKKILTAIVLFVFVALPMSVMAMTSISDSDLSTVTGQAGVSIGADITMNVSFGTVAWGDSDGLGATSGTTAGWVGLRNGTIDNLRIHMRSDYGMVDTTTAYSFYTSTAFLNQAPLAGGAAELAADYAALDLTLEESKAILASILGTQELLTIDVYTNVSDKTFVRIGVPTFEIDMASMSAEVGLWSNAAANLVTTSEHPDFLNFQKLGNIALANMAVFMGKHNYVDIGVTDTAVDNIVGVLINVGNSNGPGGAGISAADNMVDRLTMDYAAWGDTDSLGSTDGLAGWVGLTNIVADAIKVAAHVNINICTPNGIYTQTLLDMTDVEFTAFTDDLPNLLAANDRDVKDTVGYLLNKAGVIGTTSVDITLDADIRVGQFVANAALGQYLAPNVLGSDIMNAGDFQNLLGSIYMSDLKVVIPVGTGTPLQAQKDPSGPDAYAASWVTISAH